MKSKERIVDSVKKHESLMDGLCEDCFKFSSLPLQRPTSADLWRCDKCYAHAYPASYVGKYRFGGFEGGKK